MKTHSLATVIAAALIPAGFALAQGANDCASAQPLKGYGAFPFNTVGATTDGTANALCNFFNVAQIYNDVWFRFTAPATTVVDVGNCGASTLDSKIAIYDGADCSAPVIACSDDSCAAQSKCTFAVTAGSSYLIRVGGYAATGTGTGTITIAPFTALADITDKSTGVRYVAVNATSWTSSEAFAQLVGGHLVSISSQAEGDFILANFGQLLGIDRRIWIGFTDVASEGNFAWSDGTPAKYTNWNPGEPNNSSGVEHYAELLGSNGKWNDLVDAGSGYAHLAVIEFPGTAPNPCPADFDHDGFVDSADLSVLLNAWPGPDGDLNGDGITNALDLAVMLDGWGVCQ